MSIKGLNMIGPHHICVLYVATAGLQGPLMGSDEQEIVLLIYVIVDVIQNKIVGVQQYPIRPLTADTQENILSEQLTSESVLTDELIKSAGRQLVDALQEFDAYCNSLHLDPHNAGFRLITDGQLPLRQCLYPEACRKDLEVPNYYSTFYDLRKEVARYLTSTGAVVNNNNNNNNNNINNNGSRQMTPGATTTLATSAPAVVENGVTPMSTGTSLLPLPDKTHTIPALGMAPPNTHLPTAALILQQAVKQLTSGSAITTVAPPAAPTSSTILTTTTDQQQPQQNGGAGEVLMPQSVADMLECLQMNAESENEFYKREAKDMVNIVQRLITEGHRFEVPETINLTLEPGICSKDDEIDNNCVVRARGLPWQSSDQDIAKFFSGLNVAKGGVALCLSHQGRRNGEALVRFENQEHRDMALKRHKHHIGQRYIEVYRASGDDFLSVAGGKSSEAQAFLSRGAAVIVRMRGLPYDCTAKQVLEFFSSGENACNVLDGNDGVLFVRKLDGRATGDAFVLFSNETDAPKALSKHRECIGSRYIELFRSTTAEVQQVLNRSLESRPYEPEPLTPILPHLPLLPQHIITSGTKKDCIRLRGLPYEAQVEHILDFLGEYSKNIIFQGVHMVYNAQGQPSGEAFIQMDSEQSAGLTAQNKHHRYIFIGKKQRYIEVFQCSGEDMNLVLTGGIPAPGSPATKPQQVAAAAAAALLSPGGSIIPTAFHPGPNFPGYAPVQLAAAAGASPLGPPRQFLPPPIFYWPYPSPPVSPTNYYPAMAPPPPMGPQQPPPQTMLPPELVAMPPMGHMPTMDARLIQDGLGLHRPSDHDKARQNFIPNQYVELII